MSELFFSHPQRACNKIAFVQQNDAVPRMRASNKIKQIKVQIAIRTLRQGTACFAALKWDASLETASISRQSQNPKLNFGVFIGKFFKLSGQQTLILFSNENTI